MTNRCVTCGEPREEDGHCRTCAALTALLNAPDPSGAAADTTAPATDDLSAATLAALTSPLPPPATALPDPLPLPLDDPLRTLRWVVGGVFVLVVGQGVWATTAADPADPTPFLVTHGLWLAAAVWLFAVWRLLPGQRTDVFYLRSFGFDSSTATVRTDLQRAFGPGLRLSGIRGPRQRSIPWVRHLNQFAFALRYATPKFLNLEAGDDWKQRLWRSLTLARGAVLDLTELTTHVEDEVRLAYRTLGASRVLFVVDGSKSADEWRDTLARILPGEDVTGLKLIEKGRSDDGRTGFRAVAADFARTLPRRPPALSPAGSEVAYHLWAGRLDSDWLARPWVEVVGGTLLVGLLFGGLRLVVDLVAGSIGTAAALVLWVPMAVAALVMSVVQVWQFFVYLVECGSARERVLTLGTFVPALLVLLMAAVAPSVWKVQLAAQRMMAASSLKQLSLGMHNYESANGRLPAADADAFDRPPAPGRPAVSWRVKVLPYIEAEQQFKDYHMNEPWNSPHNLTLLEQMPKIFKHPARPAPPGYTYYRVFVSPPEEKVGALFTSGRPGPTLIGILDGTPNTLLIVEAAEAVPWTKPEELEYRPGGPVPKLGGYFPQGAVVAFADGSVQTIPPDLPEKKLRLLITANDGEVIR